MTTQPLDAVGAEANRVVDLMTASVPEVSQRMVAAILAEVPLYQAVADEQLLASAQEECGRNLRLFITTVRTGRPFDEADLEPMRLATRERAANLIPLDSVLHAVRVGHRIARTWVLGQVADDAVGRGAALLLMERALEHLDRLGSMTATEYMRHERHHLAAEDRLWRELLDALLSGAAALRPGHVARLSAAGLAEGPYTAVAAAEAGDAKGRGRDLDQIAHDLVRRLRREGMAAVGAVRHDEVVVVAAPGTRTGRTAATVADEVCAALSRGPGRAVSAGLSLEHTSLTDVALAYAEASSARRHAPAGTATALADVSVVDYLVAGGDAVVEQMVSPAVLSLLEGDRRRGGHLATTLRAFAEADMNAASAAAALRVHVNTVHHRLDRIAEATGRDPRAFHGLVELTLSLRLATRSTSGPPEASGLRDGAP